MAVYRDLKGVVCSAGSFTKEDQAEKAWQRAEALQESGILQNSRRGRKRLNKYVEETWFPNHRVELTTRQRYRTHLDLYIIPEFGKMRMRDIFPEHVRELVKRLEDDGVGPTVIASVKSVLSAIFTTALNDQVIFLHPCKGVTAPVVLPREYTIITPEQFDLAYHELPTADAKLLAETAIESGMRWGELAELRVKDVDRASRIVKVRRVVVEVAKEFRVDCQRFVVKDYPKGQKARRFKLGADLIAKLNAHIAENKLGQNDLMFALRQDVEQPIPDVPDPDTLGRTDPNAKGKTYKHGTLTGYTLGTCKCDHCRGAYARYRAERRAAGKDDPRSKRLRDTDGHIPNDWWRKQIWKPALEAAGIPTSIRFHDLRHSHASWLLAGGADLQVVKERLGHGSLRTTEKYLHTLPEADETALDAFTKIRNRTKPGGDRGRAA
ncbi:MAG TPA: site-specific integrase [Streptosporangiaceae bacterium]|jgi:integrase